MKKSLLHALSILIVILLPPGVTSREIPDKMENLRPGYVEVEDVIWKKAQGNPKHL